MRAVNGAMSAVRHTIGALAEGILIVAVVAALAFAMGVTTGRPAAVDPAFAAKVSPTLSVAMGQATTKTGGGSLTVSGANFTPSSGGQQVSLWVGYPDDYCSPDKTVCHGFYANPTVADDGSFSVTYQDVLLQSGTGTVKAFQWSSKFGWRTVDKVTYTVP